jgi:ArsR family transcriptional regulator, arsenate/arsenite/antimonite-responsive transcriptional repressor
MRKPERLEQLFKAVSDPTRLTLLDLLRLGSICVYELQSVLQIPQSTGSRYLAGLRHAGLVPDYRSGNNMIYSLAAAGKPQISALYELLDKSCPCDEIMNADWARFTKAVRTGICRLGPYNAARETPISAVKRGCSTRLPKGFGLYAK